MSAARILPPDEWDRLPAEVAAFCATLRPEDVAAVVVEDAGVIVARVLMLRAPLMEAYWQAPERYGNAGVTRALLSTAAAKAREWGSQWFLATAEPGPMGETLKRLGGRWLPVHTFMLSSRLLAKESECPTTSPSVETTPPCSMSSSEPTHLTEEAECHPL